MNALLNTWEHPWTFLRSLCGIFALLAVVGCGPSPEDLESVNFAPVNRDDWKVSTPGEHGIDPELVAELYFNAAKLDTLYSLLVVKNGYLIAEDYFHEGSVDQEALLQSATKSVTSSLVEIALEEGMLSSIDAEMIGFFPEIADRITDPRKREITIRQLLQMRAGYPWEESDPELWKGLLSGHYPPLIEDFPLVSDPGTKFHYSNLSSDWLGIIVARVAQTNLRSFAQERLFSPIGAEAGDWGKDWDGHNNGCGDLHMTARDAAKFGLLYLNEGEWEGEQVLRADWVRDSLRTYSVNEFAVKKVGPLHDIGYGYQWWSGNIGELHVNFAWGHGGQLIVLLKEFDMVIVTTSDPFWLEHNDQSWKHEKNIIAMVAEFIHSLQKG